jgi:tetratricopeptide (TPR) repeat protein
VRLIHGEKDGDVPLEVAFRLMQALRSSDVQLQILKGGGHRLSEPHEIDTILRTVAHPGARNLIHLLIAAAVAAAAPATKAGCPDVVTPDALVCRALESQKQGNSEAAAQSFEEAAKASSDKEPATARMWAAAGNMWIEAGQAGKAAFALDHALAMPGLEAEQRGEALLDRARAAEAQNDLKTARAKLTEAAQSISEDPFYWYFSAALAIREKDSVTAQSAIAKALTLAPSDPAILFEAGHVAHFTGDDEKARSYWMRAAGSDPSGPIGRAAAKAAEMLGVTPVVKMETQPSR